MVLLFRAMVSLLLWIPSLYLAQHCPQLSLNAVFAAIKEQSMQHNWLVRPAPMARSARRSVLTIAWAVGLGVCGFAQGSTTVNLTVKVDTAGRADFRCGCSTEKRLTAVQEQAITEAFGFAFKRAEFDPVSADEDDDDTGEASAVKRRKETYYYTAAGNRQFSKRGWRTEGELDLAGILTALSSAGLSKLQVIIIHPVSSSCQCTPPNDGPSLEQLMKTPEGLLKNTVWHPYQFATAEGGPHVLRLAYGYSNADLFRVSALFAGALLLTVLLTLGIRRSRLRAG